MFFACLYDVQCTYVRVYLAKYKYIIQFTVFPIIAKGPVQSGGGGRGGGRGQSPPIKSEQGAKKGHILLASFGLSAIDQYFLVTMFPHRVKLPAHSNFSMRSYS